MGRVGAVVLDYLRAEFDTIRDDRSNRRTGRLQVFHDRLRTLRLLDPACGCGNFLVLAYRELRLLELDLLRELHSTGQQVFEGHLIQVDVDQFHGIEYAEWPARIAEVAMWLMDHQMNQRISEAFGHTFERLPLRTSANIVQGNALRLDWRDVLPPGAGVFVLGNPPFVGKHYQSKTQKEDIAFVFGESKNSGDMDYVACWFRRAAEYIQGTQVRVGFVSTNSLTQGEQVPVVWGPLFSSYRVKIHFAHRTFAWKSEARGAAHVHVVIIGFGAFDIDRKQIVDYEPDAAQPSFTFVSNISPYLTSGSDSFVTKRTTPLANVPEMRCGNKPSDGGNLILSEDERSEMLRVEPTAERFLRRYTGSDEFINGNMRWCLWLEGSRPEELRALPVIMERVQRVREFRQRSTAEPTKRAANEPTRFFYVSQPKTEYIAVPEVSSIRRRYIPIGFLPSEIIASNKLYIIAEPSYWIFGILCSAMHTTWVRLVGGKLKSDFQYSGSMVYNTFPWPTDVDPKHQSAATAAAEAVLAARIPFLPPHGTSTLADLYDPLAMPATLAKGHAALDRAVDRCYRPEPFKSDRERVEHLFARYEALIAPLLPASPERGKRGRKKPPRGEDI